MLPSPRFVVSLSLALLILLLPGPAAGAAPGSDPGRIVFVSDRDGLPDVFTARPDGSDAVNLTSSAAIDRTPAWSADGAEITWARIVAGNADVWVMHADGTGQRRITHTPAREVAPSFAPSGEVIYGSSRADTSGGPCPPGTFDCNFELYVQRPGGPARRLTNHPAWDGFPRFSPDGAWIAFASNRSGSFALYVMRADGSGLRKLTPDGLHAVLPDWSPDGSRIAFSDNFCDTCDFSDVWMVNADGTGLHRVLAGFANDLDPSFSPDGRRLVFSSGDFVDPDKLWTTRVDGTDLRQLASPPGALDEMPDWGP